MHQRYVSQDLTHFVGRGLRDKPDMLNLQYKLLLKVVREGELLANYVVPGTEATPKPVVFPHRHGQTSSALITSSPGSLENGTLLSGSAVCFCDIPVEDLGIHMAKYSCFGLAFGKDYLIGHGATPVFYVAKSAVPSAKRDETLGSIFETIGQDLVAAAQDLMRAGKDDPAGSNRKTFWAIQNCSRHILQLIKLFDPGLPDDSEENTYMEREWRALRHVPFGLDDIRRLILPETFGRRLRDDLPDYTGQITFAETVGKTAK
jgi:hypothetical protein